jgi:hypothetical protein
MADYVVKLGEWVHRPDEKPHKRGGRLTEEERLHIRMLCYACVPYAKIAAHFGITKQYVCVLNQKMIKAERAAWEAEEKERQERERERVHELMQTHVGRDIFNLVPSPCLHPQLEMNPTVCDRSGCEGKVLGYGRGFDDDHSLALCEEHLAALDREMEDYRECKVMLK